ncbi:hypothetical protein AB0K09_14545 [Streptomyces sp. NPDC049577]|uniref:hypothetical protein n=1 Tax=Streptomyces sp. NPDC049577 TaxID=3155153 RepID=UPI0034220BE0
MSVFLMPATAEAEEYLHEIVDVMVDECGISRAEAVARVNDAWGDLSFSEWPDLIGHELPEHWAYGFCYGDVRYWDPTADRSEWVLREPPPAGAPCWTVR